MGRLGRTIATVTCIASTVGSIPSRGSTSKNIVTNRAASDANAAITGEQSRPVHENPAGLKTSPRSICVTMAATVNLVGVTTKGVRLVACEPNDSKSYEACPKETTVQSDSNSCLGLLSANEPNRRNYQFNTNN